MRFNNDEESRWQWRRFGVCREEVVAHEEGTNDGAGYWAVAV